MGTTFTRTASYEIINCCSCGFSVGLPAEFVHRRKKDGKRFYCPSCSKGQSWQKTEEDRLREQLAKETLRLEQAQRDRDRTRLDATQAKRSRAHYKGEVTRLKNRITKGVCPCCNRHFTNLERHMAGQHPDYADAPES